MIPKYYKGAVAGTTIGAGGDFVVVRQLGGSKEVLLPARSFDSNRADEVIWWDSSSMSSVKIAGMNRGVPHNWGYGEPPAGNRDRSYIENIPRHPWDLFGGPDGDDFDQRMGWTREDPLRTQDNYGNRGPRSPFEYGGKATLPSVQTSTHAPVGGLAGKNISVGHGQESINVQVLLAEALKHPDISRIIGLDIFDSVYINGHKLHYLVARSSRDLNSAIDQIRDLGSRTKFAGDIYRSPSNTMGETMRSEDDFRPSVQQNPVRGELLFVAHPRILLPPRESLQQIVETLARFGFHE